MEKIKLNIPERRFLTIVLDSMPMGKMEIVKTALKISPMVQLTEQETEGHGVKLVNVLGVTKLKYNPESLNVITDFEFEDADAKGLADKFKADGQAGKVVNDAAFVTLAEKILKLGD